MTRAWAALALAGLAGCGAGTPTPPAPDTPTAPATRADVAELARQIERLRSEVAALRAERPDAEQQFFAGERARLRAALRRGRAQVQAWKPDQTGDMVTVADRAVQTIDHFVTTLDQVADTDGLIQWFDGYLATRQQWPPNQAWLLPELLWK